MGIPYSLFSASPLVVSAIRLPCLRPLLSWRLVPGGWRLVADSNYVAEGLFISVAAEGVEKDFFGHCALATSGIYDHEYMIVIWN